MSSSGICSVLFLLPSSFRNQLVGWEKDEGPVMTWQWPGHLASKILAPNYQTSQQPVCQNIWYTLSLSVHINQPTNQAVSLHLLWCQTIRRLINSKIMMIIRNHTHYNFVFILIYFCWNAIFRTNSLTKEHWDSGIMTRMSHWTGTVHRNFFSLLRNNVWVSEIWVHVGRIVQSNGMVTAVSQALL